ncbi:hypothetical protein Btru_020424 [Bulinus truncatus]|nr:hypothetical protein Btru_020424 [Bulinus truncatus]
MDGVIESSSWCTYEKNNNKPLKLISVPVTIFDTVMTRVYHVTMAMISDVADIVETRIQNRHYIRSSGLPMAILLLIMADLGWSWLTMAGPWLAYGWFMAGPWLITWLVYGWSMADLWLFYG